ncbi:MAG TPA: hypothetical protein VMT35_12005 [Ignavibacteriaceae bacterium]|nr:hypothetical protein [Ignavibacteriaceae bacterium]
MKDRNPQTSSSDKKRFKNASSKNTEFRTVVSEELFELEMPAGRNELLNKCIELGLPVEESDDDVILKLLYEAAKDKFNYDKNRGIYKNSPSNT